MTLLRRANENTQSEWDPVPEGLFRWEVGQPILKFSEQFGNYQVEFPLTLTESERERLRVENGEPVEGRMQSWRATYRVGLSLGWFKQGAYQTTKLVDFLCFCLGTQNAKALRKWFEQGGGPPRPADRDDEKAELELIGEWLKWWEGLEVYGSIRHEDDKKDPSKRWARFGGPMPVGSLPGQKDDDYQAHARGKLRAIMTDSGETRESNHPREDVPAERYTQTGAKVGGDGSDELPF